MMRRLLFAFVLLLAAGAAAQALEQIELTEKQLQSFVASQKDIEAIEEIMTTNDLRKPGDKLLAELDRVAKKHGFAGAAELDAVATNVEMIVAGIDPKTRKFSALAVATAMQEEMEAVEKETSLDAKQKQEILDDLRDLRDAINSIKHPANIELVTKYFDKLVGARK
jgi:hypothetical protein